MTLIVGEPLVITFTFSPVFIYPYSEPGPENRNKREDRIKVLFAFSKPRSVDHSVMEELE